MLLLLLQQKIMGDINQRIMIIQQMSSQNKTKPILTNTNSTCASSNNWPKIQSQELQSETIYLNSVTERLQQIIRTLLKQLTQIENKYLSEQKKLIKQVEQKDKLIFSLTSINNNLIKQNIRMKKKSDAQFQYFVKRITETESSAMDDKKKLQQAIDKFTALISCQVQNTEENCQKHIKKLILSPTIYSQNKNNREGKDKLTQKKLMQIKTHKRTYTNTEMVNNSIVQVKNNVQSQKKKMTKTKSRIELTLCRMNPENQLVNST